jgi:hypothetical protein
MPDFNNSANEKREPYTLIPLYPYTLIEHCVK